MFRSERDVMRHERPRRPDLGGRSTVYGTRGAVACEHYEAALAGVRTLDAGGNAADACVAMAAAMAVLAPMATGMGGDAFLLFYDAKTGKVSGANGSGRAPRAASIEKLRNQGFTEMPERGGPTATVPGAVRLWENAAEHLGRLPLADLLAPARTMAAEGFPVSEVIHRYWETAEELLGRDEAAARCFLPGGRVPEPGEVFRQPDIAKTLGAVMDGGADAFYNGEIARSIARSAQDAGGLLDGEDLVEHETLWVEPISTDYRGVSVYEIPPPGQGIAALEMLNILEGFDLASLDPTSAERIHLEVEAKKLAFRDLSEKVGDPEFGEVPTEELISKEYASELRDRIDFRAASSVTPALGNDTTYLCAVDAEGNGCSFINSLYMGFGSGVVAEGTGVCLQNRGNSFRLTPGHPNALEGGKRPLHTIIPGLATSSATGDLRATFGVMGGPMQPQGHAQLLVNLIDYGMSAQEAVDHPRHFHGSGARVMSARPDSTMRPQDAGDLDAQEALLIEGRVPEEEIEKLREWGHRVEAGTDYVVPVGGAQLIRVLESGVRAAGSDPRKDGCALAQ